MKNLDHHEEAISGRHQYQDPAEMHNAVYNTNGYMHEDDGDGLGFFGGVLTGLLVVGIGVLAVAVLIWE